MTETRQNNVNMTIIEFLDAKLDDQDNDISVTKFLNDLAVGDENSKNILITEFLDFALDKYLQWGLHDSPHVQQTLVVL